MIVTEEEAKKLWCPMMLDEVFCGGTKCMAFTHVGEVHNEDDTGLIKTFACGMTHLFSQGRQP